MRTIFHLLLVASLDWGFRLFAETGEIPKKSNTTGAKDASNGFAVVELFTSEGCSSCPPADKVLAALQYDYEAKAVYIMSYHVDYWDRLGWKDVFSKAAYSTRKYKYAEWLHLSSVYTPQVVVNGTKEFVGSKESILRSVIADNLANSIPVQFELKPLAISAGKIMVACIVELQTANTSLVLTLVEKFATTKVLKGENKGHELAHVQVVREQQIISPGKPATAYFNIPANTDKSDLEVIAFLQNSKTGKMTGAARVRFD